MAAEHALGGPLYVIQATVQHQDDPFPASTWWEWWAVIGSEENPASAPAGRVLSLAALSHRIGREASLWVVEVFGEHWSDAVSLPLDYPPVLIVDRERSSEAEDSYTIAIEEGYVDGYVRAPFVKADVHAVAESCLEKGARRLRPGRLTVRQPTLRLVVDWWETEALLRDVVKQRLMAEYGEEWEVKGIPLKLREKAAMRWEQEDRTVEQYDLLDVLDLKKIISSQWRLFEPQLVESRVWWEQHLERLNAIRKRLAHPSRRGKYDVAEWTVVQDLLTALRAAEGT